MQYKKSTYTIYIQSEDLTSLEGLESHFNIMSWYNFLKQHDKH